MQGLVGMDFIPLHETAPSLGPWLIPWGMQLLWGSQELAHQGLPLATES